MILEWTEDEEKYLQKIHLQSYELYRYWNDENRKHKQIFTIYNIPIILLSGINTVISLVMAKYISQNYVSLTTSCLSMITTLMGSINHLYQIDDQYVKSLIVSLRYYKLYLRISKELSIEQNERLLCGRDLLNICHNEYMDIQVLSDPIYTNELNERLLIPSLKIGKNLFKIRTNLYNNSNTDISEKTQIPIKLHSSSFPPQKRRSSLSNTKFNSNIIISESDILQPLPEFPAST